jgi:hypothetical protein
VNYGPGVPTSVPVNSYAICAKKICNWGKFSPGATFPLAILIPPNDLFLSHLSPGIDAVANFKCKSQALDLPYLKNKERFALNWIKSDKHVGTMKSNMQLQCNVGNSK